MNESQTSYYLATMLGCLRATMSTIRAYESSDDVTITPDQIFAQLELIEMCLAHTLDHIES